ncbi:SDR family NAD(P)-dependent oxidoreductase [Nostoc ellipsosporum NOK]|nr:SDR family NAD(P)-dependent oxidoreductase [Nostoc ellipsosporum NOK]
MEKNHRRNMIVTGASGNLGEAVARRFFEEGYNVAGTFGHGEATAIAHNGAIWENNVVDLKNEKAAADFVADCTRKFRPVDAAVLTAGGYASGDLEHTIVENITQQIALNFLTAYNIVRPLFPHMQKQGRGKIYLIGSVPGEQAQKNAGSLAYGLSKSLLFRLAETLQPSAAEKGVAITVIVPSIIDTPQNRHAMPDADFSKWTSPDIIASVIYNDVQSATQSGKEPSVIHV